MSAPTIALAMDLVSRPSVTPEDAGCQELISTRLQSCGFIIERLTFGPVTNLWARRGNEPPLVVLAGHTDVVPPGPLEHWSTPPFTPTLRDGFLWGRGAADMKGGLAAMVTAVESFLGDHPHHRGSIGFLITSDEEGVAINGTQRVVAYLQQQGVTIDACLLGEPTSEKRIGDCVKNGRRGSLNGTLTLRGKQGHVAYPDLVVNPIHRFAPALAELSTTTWDNGNEYFPPTSFQISNLHAGTGAVNIVPGELNALFNFRFSTAVTVAELKKCFTDILERHGLDYHLAWSLSGEPFLTRQGTLLEDVQEAILKITGHRTRFSTAGGTSDGRFIAPTGAQVIELGLLNTTIHQVNERVALADLDILQRIYQSLLERLLLSTTNGS
ncbi:succinyl-diaminopimelate desuccinylase [Gammaproteobacteria bacterium]